jgi:hypothetical protein
MGKTVTEEELQVLHGESELDDEYRIAVLTASRDQWDELHEHHQGLPLPSLRDILVPSVREEALRRRELRWTK